MAALKGSILVTGSNGGLGSAIAKQIVQNTDLSAHYHGIFVVRNAETVTTLTGITSKAPKTFQVNYLSQFLLVLLLLQSLDKESGRIVIVSGMNHE